MKEWGERYRKGRRTIMRVIIEVVAVGPEDQIWYRSLRNMMLEYWTFQWLRTMVTGTQSVPWTPVDGEVPAGHALALGKVLWQNAKNK